MVWQWSALRAGSAVVVVATSMLMGSALRATAGGAGCHSAAISDEQGVHVTVSGFCFEPTVLRIAAGETVTWTNEDRFPHMVSAANGVWLIDRQFGTGEAVSQQFNEAGVYPYWCPLHPGMIGTVLVANGTGQYAAALAGSSPVYRGALGATTGVALMSVALVVWRRHGSLMSRFG